MFPNSVLRSYIPPPPEPLVPQLENKRSQAWTPSSWTAQYKKKTRVICSLFKLWSVGELGGKPEYRKELNKLWGEIKNTKTFSPLIVQRQCKLSDVWTLHTIHVSPSLSLVIHCFYSMFAQQVHAACIWKIMLFQSIGGTLISTRPHTPQLEIALHINRTH